MSSNPIAMNPETKVQKDTFTKQEILDAIALRPCHTTGMHDPNHTPKHVCDLQLSESLQNFLTILEIKVEDLPHKLHENCCWCHGDAKLRNWAGLPEA